MKTLNQYCPNVHIFTFHGFGLAAVYIDFLYLTISRPVPPSYCNETET